MDPLVNVHRQGTSRGVRVVGIHHPPSVLPKETGRSRLGNNVQNRDTKCQVVKVIAYIGSYCYNGLHTRRSTGAAKKISDVMLRDARTRALATHTHTYTHVQSRNRGLDRAAWLMPHLSLCVPGPPKAPHPGGPSCQPRHPMFARIRAPPNHKSHLPGRTPRNRDKAA